MTPEKPEKNEKLLLGAYVEPDFVIKFRKYCRQNDFKQRTLFRNVIEFWMSVDYKTQEHIFRGRIDEALLEICKQTAQRQASEIVDESEADAAKKKRKKGSSRSARFRR